VAPEEQPAVNLGGAQVGEVGKIDAAGRDHVTTYQGMDPALLAQALAETQTFLREYAFRADYTREKALKDAALDMRRTRDELLIITDALRTVRDRVDSLVDDRDRERQERKERQELTDWREQSRARRDRLILGWLIVLSSFWIIVLVAFITWLVSGRLGG
jgi:hypothetical protein